MSNSRPPHQSASENEKVKCDHGSGNCPSLFSRPEDMLRHKAEVHGYAKKCPWCDYSARRDYRLWNHLHEKHETRKYTPRKSNPSKISKGVSTQQPLPRVVKSPGLDNRAVVMNQDGSNLVCLPVTTEDNGHIAENDFQNMAPQDIVHFEEQLTRPQQVQLTTPSFSQPFAQPVSMAERLQQAQTSASLANIPHGLPESQHTFGYIPTSGVSNGMGVNNYPQRPPPVSNQLSISQVDFPLISDPHLISDPQSESFPAPLRSQQQHFEQPAWDSSVYPQAGYTHHEVGYQTLIDISLPFNQVAPVTPADMHNTSPRPMPAAVESAADTSEPQKSSSPTSDHFENSITDYFSGYSGNSQELAYLNDFED